MHQSSRRRQANRHPQRRRPGKQTRRHCRRPRPIWWHFNRVHAFIKSQRRDESFSRRHPRAPSQTPAGKVHRTERRERSLRTFLHHRFLSVNGRRRRRPIAVSSDEFSRKHRASFENLTHVRRAQKPHIFFSHAVLLPSLFVFFPLFLPLGFFSSSFFLERRRVVSAGGCCRVHFSLFLRSFLYALYYTRGIPPVVA